MNILQRTILIVLLYGVFALPETLSPAAKGQPPKERLRNAALTALFLFVGGWAAVMATSAIPLPAARLHSQNAISSVVVSLLFVFVFDLLFYWYHRAQHALPWLWRIHELHHSEAYMNASTGLRTHWLENPLQKMFIVVPTAYLVRAPIDTAFMTSVLMTCWLYFTHANWRLELGRLTGVICGPQLHRIHHSTLPEHRDRNFAQFFPVFDVIFGTYRAPARGEFPPTGTPEMASETPLAAAFVRPMLAWIGQLEPVPATGPAAEDVVHSGETFTT